MAVTETARAAAQELADSFGVAPRINVYRTESGEEGVDVATFADCPAAGVHSVGTVSLSDHDLGYDHDGLRLEIVAAYPAAAEAFPNMIASSALAVIRGDWRLRRGAVHTDVLGMYGLSTTLEHVVFVRPFLWGDGPRDLDAGGRKIGWLMAVPISEAERAYSEASGAIALENLLAEHRVDVLDLNRPSVI